METNKVISDEEPKDLALFYFATAIALGCFLCVKGKKEDKNGQKKD